MNKPSSRIESTNQPEGRAQRVTRGFTLTLAPQSATLSFQYQVEYPRVPTVELRAKTCECSRPVRLITGMPLTDLSFVLRVSAGTKDKERLGEATYLEGDKTGNAYVSLKLWCPSEWFDTLLRFLSSGRLPIVRLFLTGLIAGPGEHGTRPEIWDIFTKSREHLFITDATFDLLIP